ncbi:Uncharacterized conserved protein YlxW, UPF0749 family [Parafrankia irregularis]|uniref:Uncharacterized conserved protein YlxW, UPF0749 family n=1 Tax=Parafrankia irregularis TaxID=795642 RepID=A0A0S4QWW1_9ACTN|nr:MULTISPECIES: DUF881 domain-containing protein [Parafrankia]CUU59506.1 Uncharacterized conserved protein YlxW, UPF0749 family [Parafrankia irregularis]
MTTDGVVGPAPPPPAPAVASPTVGNGTPGGGSRFRLVRLASILMLALLGFGVTVVIRSADSADHLARVRPDELASRLDSLSIGGQRLQVEASGLQETRAALADDGRAQAELDRARQEADTLAVLAGTAPVTGPGLTLTVSDPRGNVDAWILVDALQELRDAGAEAIELSGVRVVASTYIIDAPGGGMTVDGATVAAPYVLRVIGEAHTLAQAMRIPGGVLDTVATRDGAQAEITNSDRIEIGALRTVPSPRFARPAD